MKSNLEMSWEFSSLPRRGDAKLRKASKRLALLAGFMLASLILLFTAAPRASAVSPQFVGLMWNGQYESLESPSDWEAVEHSGTKLVRVQVLWRQVAEKGNWKESHVPWELTFDKYFTYAAERDITLLPYLYGRETKTEEARFYRSAELEVWQQFVSKVVQRYGRGGSFWAAHPALPYRPVTVWEIWNEQNLKANNPLYWDGKKWVEKIQPRNYAEFLVATSKKITEAQDAIRKAGEPFDTKILTGGMYQEAGTSKGMSVWEFFDEIAKNGTLNNEFKSRNSGLGLHPYSFAGSEATKLTGVKENVNAARTALTSFDSSAKPLWITELGWAVPGEGLGGTEPSSSETEQANLLTSSFNWLKEQSTAKNIEYAAWYNYSNVNDPRWSYHSGLRNWFGVYRPAWWAFQKQTSAPAWPSSSTWVIDNLGGGITADPDIASWESGRLDIFVRGTDNALYRKTYSTAGGWSIWENLGGILTSGPGAVSWGPNRIDVVARATDNSVSHWAWNGSKWVVDNLGGGITADPDISSWGSNRLDIFVRGTDNALYHKSYSASGGWSIWENLGGILTSGPAAVSWGPNRIDVVARATDNTLSHWAWDGSKWVVDNLGGTINGAPSISSWESGRLDIFAKGDDNAMYRKTYTSATGWSGWEGMGGMHLSGPGAVSWGPNRIDVVSRDTDSSVTHWAWSK